ncbi:hypothetical protein SAMN05216331_12215 [Porphyromonadaceae bacterium KH3R12]|nr:hypothetical protein SAMN05216331_12215 [Porphyromonadaceae bacterium KH3R12]
MGRIDLSKSGGMSGRIGPVVAYLTKDGKQVFRSYIKPADPKTPGQLAQRAKLGIVNKGLAPLRKVIKQGYPDKGNVYRTLIGKACREAVAGTYPDLYLDYGKIQIAEGTLQLPADIRLHFDPLSHTAVFSWNAQPVNPSLPGNDNDRVHIVCFDTAHPAEVQTLARGTRSAGRASVTLPEDWEPATTHFWIYLASPDLRYNSNSMYLNCHPRPNAGYPAGITKT